MHLTEKKLVQKGAVIANTRASVPSQGQGRVTRLAPPLRPVVLPTAVLVSTPAGPGTHPSPVSHPGPNTLQLQTSTGVPSSIAINTRPGSIFIKLYI